ncbi:hypothetical protein J1614_012022 [Plenodomus biglobosus]|nr:hypothetical protein J1614_012022 [Plenodomus biglobosus]
MRYEPSEGSMMIDVSTVYSLELIQNLQNAKSKDCLFGLLNETLTPMGARLLQNNILQPLTDADVLNTRYAAVEDLTRKEEMFFATRAGWFTLQVVETNRLLTRHSTQELPRCRSYTDGGTKSACALRLFKLTRIAYCNSDQTNSAHHRTSYQPGHNAKGEQLLYGT